MAFRLIPAGSFRMGSRGYSYYEEPIHRVTIPEPFWMAETPVTQAQFAIWTLAETIEHQNHFKVRPDHPAENLDWRQAVGFCAWLTRVKSHELPEGFSLACVPTEAEWEYACRAGTDTEYYTGDGEDALVEAGWFGEPVETGATHSVRQRRPNAFHLYDLHGNVWEWCHDVWDQAAYRHRADGALDPGWQLRLDAWQGGLDRMTQANDPRFLRGGSWGYPAGWCRSASRLGIEPVPPLVINGFRVCLVRGPAAGGGVPTAESAEAEPAPGDGGRGTRPESDGAGAAGAVKGEGKGVTS